VGAEFLGQAHFDAEQLLDEQKHKWVLDLVDTQGNPVGVRRPGLQRCQSEFFQARLFFSIQYTSVATLAAAAPAKDLLKGEVPRVYFPMRAGNRVTLYHDAFQPPGPVADIQLSGGRPYREAACWCARAAAFCLLCCGVVACFYAVVVARAMQR
jgi:hypothetical protein